MKKHMIIMMVAALSIFAASAAYAGGCKSCGDNAKCNEPATAGKFLDATGALRKTLQARELELSTEYGYNNINSRRIDELQDEIGALKKELRQAGETSGICACCSA